MYIAWVTFILPQDMAFQVKCYVPFLLKKRLKQNYIQEFLKCTFIPAELERGAEVLQLDVYSKATDQNFDCGCDCCAILHLDSLLLISEEWLYHFRIQTQIAICNTTCGPLFTGFMGVRRWSKSGGVCIHLPLPTRVWTCIAATSWQSLKKLLHNKADTKKQSNCKLTRGICLAMWQ